MIFNHAMKFLNILKTVFFALKSALEAVLHWMAVLVFLVPFLLFYLVVLLVAFLVKPTIGIILLSLVILVTLIRSLVLLRRRASFLRVLETRCREEGLSMRKTGRPLLSALFRVRGGVEITEGEETIQTLFFVSCPRRLVPITLEADGTVVFRHRIRFGALLPAMKENGAELVSVKSDLLAWNHRFRFAESIPQNSCLLLSPAPLIVGGMENGKEKHVDNGVTVGNYTVYTCGAFLRHFLRETDE